MECGCRVIIDITKERIIYCPLHAAAGEMRELLKELAGKDPVTVDKIAKLLEKTGGSDKERS